MSFTPNANWVAAFQKASVQPRLLLHLTNGVSDWKALSGSSDSEVYPQAIVDMDTLGTEIDPVTREWSTAEFSVTVTDAWVRDIVVNNRAKSLQATVKLGEKSLAEADYETIFNGVIHKVNPDHKKGFVTLELLDWTEALSERTAQYIVVGVHHMEAIKSLIENAGVPSGRINSTSFDPDSGSYNDISHLVTYFSEQTESESPEESEGSDLRTRAQRLARLINGSIIAARDGKLKLLVYDHTASSVETWTSDDIDEIDGIELDANVINEVVCRFRYNADNRIKTRSSKYTQRDTDSASNYAYPGESERYFTHDIDISSWGEPTAGELEGDINSSQTSIDVLGGLFAGEREAGGSQPSTAQVSGSRPGYIMIDDEIMAVTAQTFGNFQSTQIELDDAWGQGSITGSTMPSSGTFTVTRGQLGTSAAAHTRLYAWSSIARPVIDITAYVLLANEIINRFNDGIAVISCRTGLHKIGIEVGDFVKITWPEFLGFAMDGISASKWEIISKEVKPTGSSPGIEWKLALVDSNENTKTHTTTIRQADILQQFQQEDFGTGAKVAGLDVVKQSGFAAVIEAGRMTGIGAQLNLGVDLPLTFSASKDTYVFVDPLRRFVALRETSLGGGQPSNTTSEVLVAKVVTDGTEITSVDLTVANDKPLDGDRLVGESVVEGKIGPLAVTAGKIGASAVTTTKVAQGNLGFHHLVNDFALDRTMVPNSHFGVWTRG